jgi:hypothetical protein
MFQEIYKKTRNSPRLGCTGEIAGELIPVKLGILIAAQVPMKCAKFHSPKSVSFRKYRASK